MPALEGQSLKEIAVRFAGENHLRTQKNTKQSSAQRFLNDPFPKTPFFSCWTKAQKPRNTVFTRSFSKSSRELLPSSLWHESRTEIIQKTACSEELCCSGWIFTGCIFLQCKNLGVIFKRVLLNRRLLINAHQRRIHTLFSPISVHWRARWEGGGAGVVGFWAFSWEGRGWGLERAVGEWWREGRRGMGDLTSSIRVLKITPLMITDKT